MATERNTVAELFTPIYDYFMLEGYGEETLVHPKIYKEMQDRTKEYKVDDLSGLGIWQSASELSSGNYTDPVLGYPKTYTQVKYINKLEASFESVDQDEYYLLKKEGEAKNMGRGIRARTELETSGILLNTFSVAGPDGQFIVDDDHPKNREETGTLYDNELNSAFSHDALETAETQIAANHFSMDGIPIDPGGMPLLVYPPALRGAVERVFSDRAQERPGTTNRDINRFAGMYTPVEWRYLGAWRTSGATGSNTAWFIIWPQLEFFKIIWSQKPHFTSWVDEENESYRFKGRALFDADVDNWRSIFASTGI